MSVEDYEARPTCRCGCGQPVKRATRAEPQRGRASAGMYRDFVPGHNNRGRSLGRKPRKKGGDGYWMIESPGHPRATADGFVLEHIVVAERVLGRSLPARSQVHHADENGLNNAPSNLVICQDQAYHSLLHKRLRAFQACGNPSAYRCMICQQYDKQDDITALRDGRAYHRSCNAARWRERGASR